MASYVIVGAVEHVYDDVTFTAGYYYAAAEGRLKTCVKIRIQDQKILLDIREWLAFADFLHKCRPN